MTFDGSGGVASLDRVEARRAARAVTKDSASGRSPALTLMQYVKVHY